MTEGEEKAKLNDAIVAQSKAVWWDMLIKDLTQTMHKKSKQIIEVYEDRDDSFKVEKTVYKGKIPLGDSKIEGAGKSNVWDNFYGKLQDIDVSES